MPVIFAMLLGFYTVPTITAILKTNELLRSLVFVGYMNGIVISRLLIIGRLQNIVIVVIKHCDLLWLTKTESEEVCFKTEGDRCLAIGL